VFGRAAAPWASGGGRRCRASSGDDGQANPRGQILMKLAGICDILVKFAGICDILVKLQEFLIFLVKLHCFDQCLC
jgi:hypothetical protein